MTSNISMQERVMVLIFRDKMSQEMHVGVCGIAWNLHPLEMPVAARDLHWNWKSHQMWLISGCAVNLDHVWEVVWEEISN